MIFRCLACSPGDGLPFRAARVPRTENLHQAGRVDGARIAQEGEVREQRPHLMAGDLRKCGNPRLVFEKGATTSTGRNL